MPKVITSVLNWIKRLFQEPPPPVGYTVNYCERDNCYQLWVGDHRRDRSVKPDCYLAGDPAKTRLIREQYPELWAGVFLGGMYVSPEHASYNPDTHQSLLLWRKSKRHA